MFLFFLDIFRGGIVGLYGNSLLSFCQTVRRCDNSISPPTVMYEGLGLFSAYLLMETKRSAKAGDKPVCGSPSLKSGLKSTSDMILEPMPVFTLDADRERKDLHPVNLSLSPVNGRLQRS